MSEILQTQQGQDVRYGCSVTGQPLTGTEVLSTMPSSFVDEQVQFVATATALQEDLAGVGSSAATWRRYFDAHHTRVRHGLPHRGGLLQQSAAQSAAASGRLRHPVRDGGVGHLQQRGRRPGLRRPVRPGDQAPGRGRSGGPGHGRRLGPIDDNGTYLLLQITSRTPTPYGKAKAAVADAVQAAGSAATQKALTADERRSAVSVNPQYGVWVPANASVLTPLTPEPTDVLNATANVGRVGTGLGAGRAATIPSSG